MGNSEFWKKESSFTNKTVTSDNQLDNNNYIKEWDLPTNRNIEWEEPVAEPVVQQPVLHLEPVLDITDSDSDKDLPSFLYN